ncbi:MULTISPECIES: Gfo/Idh/MocA family protein [Mycobacteriaceae]|uniref:Gfo/Idh/MocA family oxidoreductase n=3 Tax=Mycobacteriaceae TaxID=1762 RepID=A0ACC6MP17_MYCPF|nr:MULTISPECIES: Gfo/Idh/MocA family oxidoreductase [Mycobacteriaceae]MDZ5088756.1 Gfo/Idh/MocA family oxidoreductase [Mycolicibacterium parafortuitum]BBA72515.1 oxidoreductase domain-containing protein [Mycobacterium sp. PO1]GFM18698.1 oxidoreductase domain-containing protein [Mycobacterium sp. PO1]SEH58794.1 Predicted dehydrogenase [Mycolicibacterium rutilum]
MTDVASRELGLGFLGIGQAVARIFQQYPDMSTLPYRVVAAADTRSHSLARFATEFSGQTYTNAEQLCADPSVDVVYIATPPELHREHALMAARHGKHMIVEKPLAMSIDDCTAMVEAAQAAGVQLMAGHTHSFDAPVRAMAELVASGELGELLMVNTWNFNDFNRRPWPTSELRSTSGPVLNQGPHQVDIVRQIAGGLARTVRASTIWDDVRECVGGYTCHLGFESGASATLVYDARAFFDVAELHSWVAEDGGRRSPQANQRVASNFAALSQNPDHLEVALEAQKEQGRYGAATTTEESQELWGYSAPGEIIHHPYFGLTVVSCQHGAIRQSPDGLVVYGQNGLQEIPVARTMRGRAAELAELHRAITEDRPVQHDGRWGRATLEVCFAILQSAYEDREVVLSHQVSL